MSELSKLFNGPTDAFRVDMSGFFTDSILLTSFNEAWVNPSGHVPPDNFGLMRQRGLQAPRVAPMAQPYSDDYARHQLEEINIPPIQEDYEQPR